MASATVGGGKTGLGGGAIDADASGAVPMSLPPKSSTARPHAPTTAAPFHDMRDHTDGSTGSDEVSSSPTSAMASSGGGSDALSLHSLEQYARTLPSMTSVARARSGSYSFAQMGHVAGTIRMPSYRTGFTIA